MGVLRARPHTDSMAAAGGFGAEQCSLELQGFMASMRHAASCLYQHRAASGTQHPRPGAGWVLHPHHRRKTLEAGSSREHHEAATSSRPPAATIPAPSLIMNPSESFFSSTLAFQEEKCTSTEPKMSRSRHVLLTRSGARRRMQGTEMWQQ